MTSYEKQKEMHSNVQFYEKISHLQNLQHDSESKRLELERQLNTYVKSDKRIAKLKGVRLLRYWNKVCEDEKRSQWRNEQLLKDLERVEMHMSELQARSDKLRDMKKRYEDYVERVYPNWKEKIMHFQRLKKYETDQERQRELHRMEERERVARMPSIPHAADIHGQHGHMPAQQGREVYQPPNYADRNMHPATHDQVDFETTTNGHGGTLQTVSTLPSTNTLGSIRATSTPQSGGKQPSPQQIRAAPIIEQEEPVSARRHVSASSRQHQQMAPQSQRVSASPRGVRSNTHLDSPSTPTTQILQKQTEPEKEPDPKEYSYRSAPRSHSPRTPRQLNGQGPLGVDQDKTDDQDVSGWGSDVEELPLNTQEGHTPRAGKTNSSRGQGGETPRGSARSAGEVSMTKVVTQVKPVSQPQPANTGDKEASLYEMEPEVTLDGLYNLLAAIETDLEENHLIHPRHQLYKSDRPATTVIADIIENANKGSTVSVNPSETLSMVVLDQLPLLVYSSGPRCVFPDDLLRRPPTYTTEESLRQRIDVTVRGLWSKLYDHFVKLMQFKVCRLSEIAEIFAEHLIHKDSPYASKAEELLSRLLEEAKSQQVHSTHSTDTFSNTPRQLAVLKQDGEDDEDQDDDTFFGQNVAAGGGGGLTGTSDAYQRSVLGSTAKSHVSYEDSDLEDDVEEILVASTSKPQSVSGVVQVSSPLEADDDERPDSPEPSAASLPPSTSSPRPAPKTTGDNRPTSALGDTAKSGTLSFTSNKKSKAFHQDSDTDEDIVVDTGVGQYDGKDDFDFYD